MTGPRMPFHVDRSRGPDYPGRYSVPPRKPSWRVEAVLVAACLVSLLLRWWREWGEERSDG